MKEDIELREYCEKHFFKLDRYITTSRKFSSDEPEVDEATVKLSVPAANVKNKNIPTKFMAEYQENAPKHVSLTATSNGDGTVDALDKALRKLLVPVYPYLADVRLLRYAVQNSSQKAGTSSEVEVYILATNKAGKLYYGAVHCKSVIEASFYALANIYTRYFRDEQQKKTSKGKK